MQKPDIMRPPLEITFRGMLASEAVEAMVTRWFARLERVFDRVHHCAVTIELPHRSQHQGAMFHVKVELGVPDATIVVSRDHGADPSHEDVYVAIADAFHAARRQLQSYAANRRGDLRGHA